MLFNSKTVRIVTFVAAILFAVSASGPGWADEKAGELKIGIISVLSGPGIAWGNAILHGAQMAVDVVNGKGGLTVKGKKYKIKLIPYDDRYTGQGGVTAANRLIFEDKVKFIVGPISSASLIAFQPITEPQKVLVLCNTYTSKALSKEKPFTFRVVPTTREFSTPLIKWLASKNPKAKTVAILSPNDDTGTEVQSHNIAGYEAAGIKVKFKEFYERGTKDFFPVLTRILGKGVDIIDSDGSSPGTVGLIVKQARQLGFKGILVKTGGPGTPEVIRVAGKAANGFYYYTPIAEDDPKMQEFEKQYKNKYRNPMNGLTPYFYDGTGMLLKAIEEAGTIDNTTAVKDKLLAIKDYPGLLGKLSWTGEKVYGINRQLVTPSYVGQVQDGKQKTLAKLQ